MLMNVLVLLLVDCLVECSNNGICDRNTGMCECFAGFRGDACEHINCPSTDEGICSGKGSCLPMQFLAQNDNALPLTYINYKYDSITNNTAWDGLYGFGCVCDSGWKVGLGANETQQAEYFGVACEKRRCPTGDNPVTTTVDETDCNGLSKISGNQVGLPYNLCHNDCSSQGVCDYDTGLCSCFGDFYGANCGTRRNRINPTY